MSALGQKQTFAAQNAMSALPPKADIFGRAWDVCFVPKADIASLNRSPRRRSSGMLQKFSIPAKGAARLHPLTIPKAMISAPASQVSLYCGIKGPTFAVSSACASATHAIGQAFHMVRSGIVTCAVTGGTEASITFGAMKGWEAMRIMSPDTCRPFSKDRKGMLIGEGAAVVVLEALDHARSRGADILAEIVGFGMSADSKDLTAPDANGMARAITATLADAALVSKYD